MECNICGMQEADPKFFDIHCAFCFECDINICNVCGDCEDCCMCGDESCDTCFDCDDEECPSHPDFVNPE